MDRPFRSNTVVPWIQLSLLATALVSGSGWIAHGASAQGETLAKATGRVVSIEGEATARASGGEPRTLACGALIFEGDEVSTSEDAALGVLLGSVYAGLAESTRLAVGSLDAIRIELARGHVRIVDASTTGAVTVATPGLEAAAVGRDAEAVAEDRESGGASQICSWADAIEVAAVGGSAASRIAVSGSCAARAGEGPLRARDGVFPPLAIANDPACREQRLAALESHAHLTPDDVSGARVPRIPNPSSMSRPTAVPCQELGNHCSQNAGRDGGAAVPVEKFPDALLIEAND